MPFVFDTTPPSPRWRAWQAWRRLTAPPLVLGLLLAVFAAAIAAFMLLVSGPSQLLMSFFLVALGLALGSTILFVFATTYYPAQPPRPSVKELLERRQASSEPVALVPVLSFEMLHLLNAATTGTGTDLAAAVTALINSQGARDCLTRLQVPADDLTAHVVTTIVPKLSFDEFSQRLLAYAHAAGSRFAATEHALAVVLLHPAAKAYLRRYQLNPDDIHFTVWWVSTLREHERQAKRWWAPERLLHVSGIGTSWAAGYTPLIDRFLRLPAAHPWDHLTQSRRPYLDQVIATLARAQQANVLLVGQPGGGRMGIIAALAHAVHHNEAHPALNNLRVIYIHLGEIVAQGQRSAEQLGLLSYALREIEHAGNIIAVFDGLSSLLTNDPDQSLNITEIMRPFFSSPLIRTVTLLSPATYHSQFEGREDLRSLFEVIQLPPASPADTLETLARAIPAIERQHNLLIPYDALRALVDETDGILQSVPYPERAFDVLDEVLVIAQEQQRQLIDRALIQEHLTRKTGIPLTALRTHERSALLSLEERMHQRIVNQRPAIAAVVKALIRARTGTSRRTRPIGTFLFLGPTGVGKTETTKALAATYFGSEDALVRFDMSEFQGEDAVAALIGTPARAGRLTSAVIDHPYTVVLLDELEKSHRTVHQLLLQVLDEGRLTDGRGAVVSFRHTLIIATSNAGAEFIRQSLGENGLPANFDHDLREHLLRQQIFAPEFLNRFDGVITFTPLSRAHVADIARRQLAQLNQRLDDEHGIRLIITEELIDYVATIGYDQEFGARPLARAIQNTVEYAIARRLVAGSVPPGTEITLSLQELKTAQATS